MTSSDYRGNFYVNCKPMLKENARGNIPEIVDLIANLQLCVNYFGMCDHGVF